MRATKRRRPLPRAVTDDPGSVSDRHAMAAQVTYVGSPEHKDTPSFAGNPPKPRPRVSFGSGRMARRYWQLL